MAEDYVDIVMNGFLEPEEEIQGTPVDTSLTVDNTKANKVHVMPNDLLVNLEAFYNNQENPHKVGYDSSNKTWESYEDPPGSGNWAIAYGLSSILDQNGNFRPVKAGDVITDDAASNTFEKRANEMYNLILKDSHISDDFSGIDLNKQTSFLSLLMNTGYEGFKYKNILTAEGEDDWQITNAYTSFGEGDFNKFLFEAFDATEGFVRDDGVTLPGLQNRRDAEKDLWEK